MENKEMKPQAYLSPTSINTYAKCPRSYFYNYLAKIKTKANIHMVKGTIIHKVLEDFFRGYKPNMNEHLFKLFDKVWESNNKRIKDLELTEEELHKEHKDCINILVEYLSSLERQINALIDRGKAENEQHAYYLLKPKFREKYIKSEELKCAGFIDRVHEGYDGLITIGDYKTSNRYGIGISQDYKRQIAIYSLLYSLKEKKTPDFTSVIFLRYGVECLLEVTPSLLKYARNEILDTYNKTRSTNFDDYPKKEGSLCRWCDYKNYCSGHTKWEKDYRMNLVKAKLEKRQQAQLIF